MKKAFAIAVIVALLFAVGCSQNGNEQIPKPSINLPTTTEAPSVPPTEPQQTEPQQQQGAELWNEQEWYGWWSITNGTGVYAGNSNGGSWWDACAKLDIGGGTITVWDEDTSLAEPLGKMQAQISTEEFIKDCLVVGNGTFIDMPTAQKYWVISPNGATCENMIIFTGEYKDGANPGSSFEYIVMLRPWGTVWDDVGANQLPYNYASWYLPLVEGGAAMPETIG